MEEGEEEAVEELFLSLWEAALESRRIPTLVQEQAQVQGQG